MLAKMKTALSLVTFAIVALLVAGLTYRVIHVAPKPAGNRTAEATPPNPGRSAAENPQLTDQEKAAPAPPAPATASQAPVPGSNQAAKPPAPPPTATMPAENKMSAANRRNVQEALRQRGYYHGPVDGIFGARTRAAIRRFQNSIGAKSTGYLTAVEASRLVRAS